MGFMVSHRPRFIFDIGQGALIAAQLAMPLVAEAACRARIVWPARRRGPCAKPGPASWAALAWT
eukprot:9144718-Alexandrium_andersonii.AAC.1